MFGVFFLALLASIGEISLETGVLGEAEDDGGGKKDQKIFCEQKNIVTKSRQKMHNSGSCQCSKNCFD